MKKMFVLFITLFTFINANAQWIRMLSEEDEMLEQESCEHFIYMSKEGSFVFADNNNILMLTTNNGIFDYKSYGGIKNCTVLIGFYDNEMNFIEKKSLTFISTRWDTIGVKDGKMKNKIIDWLLLGNKVRFVADQYNRSKFDLIISENPYNGKEEY